MINNYTNKEKLVTILFIILVYFIPAPTISISTFVYSIIVLLWIKENNYKKNQLIILLLLPLFLMIGLTSGLIKETLLAFITLLIVSILKLYSFKFDVVFIKKILKLCMISSLIYLIIDSNFIRLSDTGRLHLSNLDPNFSGVGLLFLMCIAFYYRLYTYSICIIILAIFLLSRGALISISIFLILNWVISNKKIKIYLPNFTVLIVLTNILLYFLCDFLLHNIFIPNPINYYDDPRRVIDIFDESNYGRFIGFNTFYEYLISGKYNFEGNLGLAFRSGVPHNSLMQVISANGLVLTTIYFSILGKILNYKYNQHQVALALSFSFYALFLHKLYVGYYFMMFIITMNIISHTNTKTKC